MFGLPAAATKVGNQSSPEMIPFSTFPAGTRPGQRIMQGTRKPPSSAVPLPPANGVWPPSGQVKFSAPLSVVNTTIVLSSKPSSLSFFMTAPTISSSWANPPSEIDQPFSELRMFSYFSERWVTTCMRVGLSQTKNGLLSRFALSMKANVFCENFVVHRLHPLRIKRAGVLDALLADLAPARLHRRIVAVGRPGMDHVAGTDFGQQRLRVVAVGRVFHRVEVIEVAIELIEAVHGRQELVEVAEVVLAELAGGVAHGFQRRRDGRRLRRHADRGAGLADRGKAGADRQFAGDEVGASCRAARLGVVVGEAHAFGGELVEVWRPARHDALVVGADVEPADVIAHDEDDVRPLAGRCGAAGVLAAAPARNLSARPRQRRSGDERTAAQQQIAAFQSSAWFAPSP